MPYLKTISAKALMTHMVQQSLDIETVLCAKIYNNDLIPMSAYCELTFDIKWLS